MLYNGTATHLGFGIFPKDTLTCKVHIEQGWLSNCWTTTLPQSSQLGRNLFVTRHKSLWQLVCCVFFCHDVGKKKLETVDDPQAGLLWWTDVRGLVWCHPQVRSSCILIAHRGRGATVHGIKAKTTLLQGKNQDGASVVWCSLFCLVSCVCIQYIELFHQGRAPIVFYLCF